MTNFTSNTNNSQCIEDKKELLKEATFLEWIDATFRDGSFYSLSAMGVCSRETLGYYCDTIQVHRHYETDILQTIETILTATEETLLEENIGRSIRELEYFQHRLTAIAAEWLVSTLELSNPSEEVDDDESLEVQEPF